MFHDPLLPQQYQMNKSCTLCMAIFQPFYYGAPEADDTHLNYGAPEADDAHFGCFDSTHDYNL